MYNVCFDMIYEWVMIKQYMIEVLWPLNKWHKSLILKLINNNNYSVCPDRVSRLCVSRSCVQIGNV